MAVDLAALAADLTAETEVLERVLVPLDDEGWNRPTPAPGWRVRDQITHLAYFDEAATNAAVDPDRFRADLAEIRTHGDDITAVVQARHASSAPDSVFAWFRTARAEMLRTMTSLDPSTRVPWYGPDMSIASSLTARIMETWAHGQDVFDALDEPHPVTRALAHVAYLGVRTVPNSFVTRGLDVPDAPIFVALHAPDGEQWQWGDASAADRVEGDAVEFCGVVTQRRNVADTSLAITGAVATQWMQIAQAFAGPPGEGRPPRS